MFVVRYDVEALYEAAYWLVDVFPSQLPESEPEKYLTIERELLSPAKLKALYGRFAEVFSDISRRFLSSQYIYPEDNWTNNPDDSQISREIQKHRRVGSVQLFLPTESTLLTLNAEDLYITVYQPSKTVLNLLNNAANKRGLFLRQPEQLRRIEENEKLFDEAKKMTKAGELTDSETERLNRTMKLLESYYESIEWKNDFSDDESGLLPKRMKRGVLSEDGIYNLIEKYNEK